MINQDCETITTCDNHRRLKTAKIVCTWNSNCRRTVIKLSYWEVDDIKMLQK